MGYMGNPSGLSLYDRAHSITISKRVADHNLLLRRKAKHVQRMHPVHIQHATNICACVKSDAQHTSTQYSTYEGHLCSVSSKPCTNRVDCARNACVEHRQPEMEMASLKQSTRELHPVKFCRAWANMNEHLPARPHNFHGGGSRWLNT